MKLLPTKTSKVIYDIPDSILPDIVAETYRNILTLQRLEEVLSPEYYQGKDIDDVEQEQLDEILVASGDLSTEYIYGYREGRCAPTDAIQRRVDNAAVSVDNIKSICDKISDRYVAPSTKEASELLDVVKDCLGELGVFLYFGFSIDETYDSIKDNKELVITASVKQYVDDSHIRIETMAQNLSNIVITHRPVLNVFDTLPHLAAEFYTLAGSLLHDFEGLQDYIDTKMVVMVVNGELDPEDAVQQIYAKVAQDNG